MSIYTRTTEREAHLKIPVYSFVAFSNTGKTTFLEKLVPVLKSRGLRVAVYKHDGHDFDIDKPGKDSWRMTQAGADVTAISSSSKAVIMENRYISPEEVVESIKNVDIIIVEGWKTGPWKKIAMRRQANGKDFPVPPENCFALITDTPFEGHSRCFGLEDVFLVADAIIEDMKSENN